jgi:hypothetical protein
MEFVLLNYNSQDGLHDWVLATFPDELRSGRLRYFHEHTARSFFFSHARNVCAKLATGDILCNVDADHFVATGFVDHIRGILAGQKKALIRARGLGCFGGRITLFRKDFWRLGGYNEEFVWGWGCEDTDLIRRAEAMDLKSLTYDNDTFCTRGLVIQHYEEASISNAVLGDMTRSTRLHNMISQLNLDKGELVANWGYAWGQAVVTDHEGKEIYVV